MCVCVCSCREKFPGAELCKVHRVCPCRSTGWRTDRWWPHSPQRTTFQLVLIDLCGFVCATRTRTPVFIVTTSPHFLSLFFVVSSSLCLAGYQITQQAYLCPHVAIKVIQQESGTPRLWHGLSRLMCRRKPLPLSKWHCGSHNRHITVCGLVLKWCLTQRIMHYLWWCWCSGLLSNT